MVSPRSPHPKNVRDAVSVKVDLLSTLLGRLRRGASVLPGACLTTPAAGPVTTPRRRTARLDAPAPDSPSARGVVRVGASLAETALTVSFRGCVLLSLPTPTQEMWFMLAHPQ